VRTENPTRIAARPTVPRRMRERVILPNVQYRLSEVIHGLPASRRKVLAQQTVNNFAANRSATADRIGLWISFPLSVLSVFPPRRARSANDQSSQRFPVRHSSQRRRMSLSTGPPGGQVCGERNNRNPFKKFKEMAGESRQGNGPHSPDEHSPAKLCGWKSWWPGGSVRTTGSPTAKS
jgi:hypothetical protein